MALTHVERELNTMPGEDEYTRVDLSTKITVSKVDIETPVDRRAKERMRQLSDAMLEGLLYGGEPGMEAAARNFKPTELLEAPKVIEHVYDDRGMCDDDEYEKCCWPRPCRIRGTAVTNAQMMTTTVDPNRDYVREIVEGLEQLKGESEQINAEVARHMNRFLGWDKP